MNNPDDNKVSDDSVKKVTTTQTAAVSKKTPSTKKPVARRKLKANLENMVTGSGLDQTIDLNSENLPIHPDRIWPD